MISVKFTAELAMSRTSFGVDLDLRQRGAIASPWRLAVCPTDHFVLYSDSLTKEDIAPEERLTWS